MFLVQYGVLGLFAYANYFDLAVPTHMYVILSYLTRNI